jgi:hypothetical protein
MSFGYRIITEANMASHTLEGCGRQFLRDLIVDPHLGRFRRDVTTRTRPARPATCRQRDIKRFLFQGGFSRDVNVATRTP